MSQVHRKLMKGSEKIDSLTWDAHKALSVPLQCAGFLLKHKVTVTRSCLPSVVLTRYDGWLKGLMPACNSTRATYLFQQDKMNYDISYDTGDKSIQCGRLNDALKFWLMWKAKVCIWRGVFLGLIITCSLLFEFRVQMDLQNTLIIQLQCLGISPLLRLQACIISTNRPAGTWPRESRNEKGLT